MNYYKALLAELSERLEECPPCPLLSEYNFFDVLAIGENEKVMCRFLADLLSPDGAHGLGGLFLRSFLREVLPGIPLGDALLSRTTSQTEFPISGDRRIDIVLQNSRYFIPIEVKINAGEQPGQCYDYCQYAKNAPLVYLTKFGTAPSEYSRKKPDGTDILPLDRIRCVSWSGHICRWLTDLLPQLDGPLKTAVTQYIEAIHMFTDKQEWKIMEKEQSIQAALTSPMFFHAGLELERSMNAAKIALMRLMFDCFREEMGPVALKYGLELEQDAHYYSYEAPQHERFYDSNSSTWPGLNYVVQRAKFQIDGLQMWFRIEVDHQLCAGFTLFDTKAEPQTGYSKGFQVDDITPELEGEAAQYLDRDIFAPSDWWLTWCYPNGKYQVKLYDDVPDFKAMNPCAVSLVDPQKRREYVRNAIYVFERELLEHLL